MTGNGIAKELKRWGVLLALAGVLLGCAATPSEKDKAAKETTDQLYRDAKHALDTGDYKVAIQRFENLTTLHPFGAYAQQAQLEIAYAYYKYDEPDSAVEAADQFIKLYPRNEGVDYAYYIKALANFPTLDWLDRKFHVDPTNRNPKAVHSSLQGFEDLVRHFPDSPYTADARQRIIYLRDLAAGGEILTTRFYMQKKAYVAAANRAKYVLEHYDQTPSVPEALRLLAQAYDHLGLSDLAADARRVFALNYPEAEKTKTDTTKD